MLTILQTVSNSLDYGGARHILHPAGIQLYLNKILQMNNPRSIPCKTPIITNL